MGAANVPGGAWHAFLWQGGAMADLGTLAEGPGFATSVALDINSAGHVVGASDAAGGARHAFLWQDGRMIDLNGRLPADSDWVLSRALAINDAGQILALGSRPGAFDVPLLLTPAPEDGGAAG